MGGILGLISPATKNAGLSAGALSCAMAGVWRLAQPPPAAVGDRAGCAGQADQFIELAAVDVGQAVDTAACGFGAFEVMDEIVAQVRAVAPGVDHAHLLDRTGDCGIGGFDRVDIVRVQRRDQGGLGVAQLLKRAVAHLPGRSSAIMRSAIAFASIL